MWSYLRTRGIDPKQTQLKPELDRVKSYMEKMKMIIDKQDAPKVDKSAAVRLLRNALWQKAQGKNTKTDSETNENSDMTT
ncbi:unnamed protein product [Didymodactylos carnosus]|nr:unnamed protein product [Didymodactylos carnosus]CAF3638779.1 unnamed protein product [Didymodactylos carnosus]